MGATESSQPFLKSTTAEKTQRYENKSLDVASHAASLSDFIDSGGQKNSLSKDSEWDGIIN